MTNSSQKQEVTAVNKSNPGADGRKFIALPSNVRYYCHHTRMKAEKLFLYALLIDYYNVVKGEAWPSIERLALDYGKTPKTTGLHIRDLEAVGLVAVKSRGRYIPLDPLSADEFYAKFPEAWTNYQTAFSEMEERKKIDSQRWTEYRNKTRTRS